MSSIVWLLPLEHSYKETLRYNSYAQSAQSAAAKLATAGLPAMRQQEQQFKPQVTFGSKAAAVSTLLKALNLMPFASGELRFNW